MESNYSPVPNSAEYDNQANSTSSTPSAQPEKPEYLTKGGLITLIEEDPMIKQAICRLMSQVFACEAQAKQDNTDVETLQKIDQTPSDSTLTMQEEQPQKADGIQTLLLARVRAEENILPSWLNQDDDEQLAQARVVAFAADFDRILTAWDALAKHCKEKQQALTVSQNMLLETILKVFNLTTVQQQATLVMADIGIKYDYELHNNIGADGKKIQQQLMPGIKNVAGKLVKKPLVLLER